MIWVNDVLSLDIMTIKNNYLPLIAIKDES